MCVISSFSHEEIDLNRSGSRGVSLLKAYLEYAAGGGKRLPAEEHAGEGGLNAFEADVRDALEAQGVRTRPQFGASRYRIDLAAMHPDRAGRPVLAIECDGASYDSSATARDRDRLRQRTCSVLAGASTASGQRIGSTSVSRRSSAPFPRTRRPSAWRICQTPVSSRQQPRAGRSLRGWRRSNQEHGSADADRTYRSVRQSTSTATENSARLRIGSCPTDCCAPMKNSFMTCSAPYRSSGWALESESVSKQSPRLYANIHNAEAISSSRFLACEPSRALVSCSVLHSSLHGP